MGDKSECILLLTTPTLNLLFACDRVSGIIETLVVDQSVYLVSFCEPFDFAALILPDSSHQAIGYSGVENNPALVRHHVNVESLHLLREVLRFAQDDNHRCHAAFRSAACLAESSTNTSSSEGPIS